MVENPTWRKAPMQLATFGPLQWRFDGKSLDTPQQMESQARPTGKIKALRR